MSLLPGMLRGFALRTRGCWRCWRSGNAEIAVLRGQLGELTALQAEASGLRERAAELEAQVADLAARVEMNSEQLEAAVVGRAGQAGTEVAAGEVRAEARSAQGAAGGDDAAQRQSRPCGAA